MNYHARMIALHPSHDPRQIEAYMRLAHPTLDALSASEFEREARLAAACIVRGGRDMAQRLAVSMGTIREAV